MKWLQYIKLNTVVTDVVVWRVNDIQQ